MSVEILLLLILFQIKHFICDYPLQSKYHLRKGGTNGWIRPLLSHCAYHAFATFLILVWINPIMAFGLSLVELAVHFVIDRVKASPNILGKYKPDNKLFWWSLGLDQMMHHLTYVVIIYTVVG